MERQLWDRIEGLVRSLARTHRSPPKVQLSDGVIVRTYFWAVLHDRPVWWACDPRHWPAQKRRFTLPSQSTMSRRLRQAGVQRLLEKLTDHVRDQDAPTSLKAIDAKPLPVGSFSHDREAKWGRVAKGFAKGYKLFCLWDEGQKLPAAWHVDAMPQAETTVAQQLLQQLRGRGVLLGDALYDVNALFIAAEAHHHQLLSPRKFPHKPLGQRARSAARVRGHRLMRRRNVRRLYARRIFIEQRFAQLTNSGGSLSPLPAWVRRRHRVRLWVHAKLLIAAVRRQIRQPLAA
jgi:hypothetical protein